MGDGSVIERPVWRTPLAVALVAWMGMAVVMTLGAARLMEATPEGLAPVMIAAVFVIPPPTLAIWSFWVMLREPVTGWIAPALVRRMWTIDASVPGSTRTACWDTPSAQGSSAGTRLSRRAVGHLGFTGTSLWFDAERRLSIVLLTNRVHPSRENDKLKAFRPLVHDLVLEAL